MKIILIGAPCTKWMWCGMHASGAFLAVSVEKAWSHCSSFAVHVSHFVHQRKLLFWKSMFLSKNVVLASRSRLTSSCRFLATGSLYNVTSRELSTSKIKPSVWYVFANSVELWWTLYTCVWSTVVQTNWTQNTAIAIHILYSFFLGL